MECCSCADYHIVRRPGKSWLIFPAPLSTFADARRRCQKEGGDLVTVSSPEENRQLNNAARSVGCGDFWIGLVSKTGLRTTDKSEWAWISQYGTGNTPTFDGWKSAPPAQPDNSRGLQGLTARMETFGWGKLH